MLKLNLSADLIMFLIVSMGWFVIIQPTQKALTYGRQCTEDRRTLHTMKTSIWRRWRPISIVWQSTTSSSRPTVQCLDRSRRLAEFLGVLLTSVSTCSTTRAFTSTGLCRVRMSLHTHRPLSEFTHLATATAKDHCVFATNVLFIYYLFIHYTQLFWGHSRYCSC